jgi:hypothetical protein
VPGTGEALETGCRAGVGTRCHVVFLLNGVLYSQGVPSLSSLYSTMGIRHSSEHPLVSQEEKVKRHGVGELWAWPVMALLIAVPKATRGAAALPDLSLIL